MSQRSREEVSFQGAWTNGTQNGAAVNTAGYRRVQAKVIMGTGAATTGTFTIEESANGTTGWTAIPLSATPPVVAASTTVASEVGAATVPETTVVLVDIDPSKNRKNFYRINAVGTGTAGSGMVGLFSLFNPVNAPPPQVATVLSA